MLSNASLERALLFSYDSGVERGGECALRASWDLLVIFWLSPTSSCFLGNFVQQCGQTKISLELTWFVPASILEKVELVLSRIIGQILELW